MAGPKAPKDPKKRGSSFYICMQKGVAGSPQPDGRGIQYIYLNDGRLVSFAKVTGNITDEAMLENLKTAEGFRKMVEGIGVTVDAPDKEQSIDFVFQMYGKTDIYSSGTVLKSACTPDGMEQILWLNDYDWSEDDDKPGQIRFEFPKAEQMATVDVKLYLREGYEVPEQEELHKVAPEDSDYKAILTRSLVQTGNNERLKHFIDRAKRGEQVTMAFLGGSITQGAGAVPITTKSYAYQTWEKFTERFSCKDNVKFIKAGVGGTSSELGIVRFERDVLREGTELPDVVVVEYAVNDAGDETKGVCYESLVHKILSLSERTAVVLLFSVFADDWNLQERLAPIGGRYELPMVSIRDGVVEQFYKKYGEGKAVSKAQFFYDCYHPTNTGHCIMADSLMHLFEAVDNEPYSGSYSWKDRETVYGSEFAGVRLLDKHTNSDVPLLLEAGSFSETDENLQAVEMDAEFEPVKEFPYNWHRKAGSEPFRMKIKCRALFMVSKDSGENAFGKAVVTVDGKQALVANPREAGWTHCNSQLVLSEKETAEHLVEISMQEGDEDRQFTILGFGYVE